MSTQPSADAVAIAASNLVLAAIQANASAGHLAGLSGRDAPRVVEKLFAEMVNIVQSEFAVESPEKSRMKIFGE